MSTKKNIYIAPQCESVEIMIGQLMAISTDQLPVDPDTPATPAARDEHRDQNNIWDNVWSE